MLALHAEVLFSAAAAQQVIRVPAPALAPEPAVHVGPVATVTLPIGAPPTARMTLFHVLVETGHVHVAELAHHHLFTFLRLAHVLRTNTHRNDNASATTRSAPVVV